MKKLLAGVLAGAMLLGVGSLRAEAYYGDCCEGSGHGGHGGYHRGGNGKDFGYGTAREMTPAEKVEFKSYHQKRIDYRKQMMQEDVRIGRMSQEEADLRISIMEKQFQRMEKNNFKRPVEFTEQDREEMRADRLKMIEIRQNFIKQQVANGKISPEEGNRILERMENAKTNDNYYNERGEGYHNGGGRRHSRF